MAATTPLQWLWATAVQGAADAYISQSFATGLYGQTGIAYQIRELQIEWPAQSAILNGNYELALGIKSLAAMPNLVDKSVLWRRKRMNGQLTAAGFQFIETIDRWLFGADENFFVVSDPLYLMCDSNATTLTNTFMIKIGYQQVKLNDVDRLSLLASSLQ